MIRVRAWQNRRLVFDAPAPDVEHSGAIMGEAVASILNLLEPHLIEIDFGPGAEPARYLRIGSDASMMIDPMELNLDDGKPPN
jgi:hypothetical protein